MRLFGWFRGKKEVPPVQCLGLLKTGKQTIPCPRFLPCIHHEEGKGIFDLTEQRPELDSELADLGELTDSEKLEGMIAFLEVIHGDIRLVGEAMGVEFESLIEGSVEEEPEGSELQGEADSQTDSEIESDSEQSDVLSLDDIPPGSKL